MKKINKMPDIKMMTDIEAALVWAIFEYGNNEDKRKGVDVGILIRNFAEALILRAMLVEYSQTGQLVDYPGEEEIVALAEKACLLAVEMNRRHG